MNDFVLTPLRDKFSRLFVLATQYKINLSAFTKLLCESEFVKKIEANTYDPIFDEQIQKTFSNIIGFEVEKDSSYGVYNDAYWAGKNYFDLFFTTNKSFEYIFLKLPLDEMLNLYIVFHEMDFSSLEMFFRTKVEEKTVIRLLCINRRCSLNDVSKDTFIPLSTLKKYNSDDKYLFRAEFQNIAKLVKFFNVGYSLFIE